MMYKIIIADDDEILLQGLTENFDWSSIGIQVIGSYDNGLDALNAIKTEKPHILLTDIKMPIMDGLELISNIQRQEIDIVSVIVSAHDEFSYAQKAIKQGAKDYILKPINVDNLENVMRTIVEELKSKTALEEKVMKVDELENEKTYYDIQKMFINAMRNTMTEQEFLDEYSNLMDVSEGEYTAYYIKFNDETDIAKKNTQLTDKLRERNIDSIVIKDQLMIISESKKGIDSGNLKSILKESTSLDFMIIKGKKVNGVYNLYKAYDSILFLDDLYYLNEHQDISIDDYKEIVNDNDSTCEDIADEIVKVALLGNKKAVDEYVEEYKRLIKIYGANGKTVFTYTVSMILYSIERECKKMNIDADEIFGDMTEVLKRIMQENTLAKAIELLREKLIDLAELIAIKTDSSNVQIISKATKYIDEKFKDPEIRITDVAEHVCLSKSYFSIVFKEQKGISFTDYLLNLRMEEAKRLLENTNYRSYEVGFMVGYNNPTYFSSAFKKYSGSTPSEYSKQHKSQ